MKIKMVSYYVGNISQIFVTFEYQNLKFDMFKNFDDPEPSWEFIEDEGFTKLSTIANLDLIEINCTSHLQKIDSIFL